MKIELDLLHSEVRVGSQKFIPEGMSAADVMVEARYNTKVKVYGDGKTRTTHCKSKVFGVPISERRRKFGGIEIDENAGVISIGEAPSYPLPELEPIEGQEEKAPRDRDDNVRRANERIYDIFQLNEAVWAYFVTVTFDPRQVNHHNAREVMHKLGKWLNNQNVRKGLQYLLIPEYHKNGGIHSHVVINDTLKVVDSGTRIVEGYDKPMKLTTIRSKGLTSRIRAIVYNLPEWPYGFSTAVRIDKSHDGVARIANYLTKYITKDTEKIFGKRYWFSRGLKTYPDVILRNTEDEAYKGIKPYWNAHDGNVYHYYDSMNKIVED